MVLSWFYHEKIWEVDQVTEKERRKTLDFNGNTIPSSQKRLGDRVSTGLCFHKSMGFMENMDLSIWDLWDESMGFMENMETKHPNSGLGSDLLYALGGNFLWVFSFFWGRDERSSTARWINKPYTNESPGV